MHDTDDNLSDVLATLNRLSQRIASLQQQILGLDEQAKQGKHNQEDSQWQSVLRSNSTNQGEPTV